MRETSGRSGQLTRRSLVVGGLAALTGACTADPRIGPAPGSTSPRPTVSGASPSSSPAATPSFAGAEVGAALEQLLAARTDGVAHRWTDDVSGAAEDLLTGVRDAHRAHAAALTSAEPTARPSSSTSAGPRRAPKADRLEKALGDLAGAETDAAAAHRDRALAASGFSALLWASLGVAATSFAAAVSEADGSSPAGFARAPQRHDLPTVSDTTAIQDLVAQLHAIIYGYQLAIGQLDTASTKDRALNRLRQHRQLRDTLIAALTSRSAMVPVAAAAYVPSVRPTTPARSAQLIRKTERALLPFVGLWLASAPHRADRVQAYAALTATDAAARAWGAGLLVWPGWNG